MAGDLRRRLGDAVDGIAAIDTHTHLDVMSPAASSPWQVLSYHNYTTELVAAGMPANATEGKSADKERVIALAGYFRLSETTTHAWMMRRLLSGLYGWDEPVSAHTAGALYERMVAASQQADWERRVLAKAGIVKSIATADWRHPPCAYNQGQYILMAQAALVPDAGRSFIRDVERDAGVEVSDLRALGSALAGMAAAWRAAGMRAVRLAVEDDPPFVMPESCEAEAAFTRYLRGDATGGDLRTVRDFTLDAVCREAGRNGLVVQVYLGRGLAGRVPYPALPVNLAPGLFRLIGGNPGTRFDVATVSGELLNQFTIMAKHMPNLHLSGCWWFVQFPSVMRRIYRFRAEVLPASKWSAMFTDAYVVEWAYAKSLLIRKELAAALAACVEDGYLQEDDAVAVARNVLHDSPATLYGIE
ncbi:MAG TPA: hypothetical protein VM221_00300 [Armatimonadota bacterium]|nr:hypothetical protein [Armatimonadota bacterium]